MSGGDDRGKGPVLSTTSTEHYDDISVDEIFESIDPVHTIKLALRKANKELINLVGASGQTKVYEQRIADLCLKIQRYGDFIRSMSRGRGDGPGSSNDGAQMHPHNHIATRLFSSPNVVPQTDSVPSRGDAMPPQHMPDRAGHVDDHEIDLDFADCYPGATRIQSTGTTVVTFLVDEDMVPLKIVQLPGNNVFYGSLHKHALELFGLTIRQGWNRQDSNLKNLLITRLVGEFGDTFNKPEILKKTGKHLKHVREAYRNKLVQDPKCERPLMVPEREWKEIIADAREIAMKTKGRTPPGPGRLQDTSKATKARKEKHGQHKLGQGGYGRLKARIGDMYHDAPTKEDLKVGFLEGFKAVVARRRNMGQSPCVSLEDMESNNATTTPDIPHPDPHINPSVVPKAPSQEHVDVAREHRSASTETLRRPPTMVSTDPNLVDAPMQTKLPRRNTRSNAWHEVLRTDDATPEQGKRTEGHQYNSENDLISSYFESNKRPKKIKKKKNN